MRESLRLGTIAGIKVGIHWSIALIAILFATSLAGTVLPSLAAGYAGISYFVAAIAVTGLFLASIIAHELGHSLVAERNGVGVKGITLFALGGVARLENEPKTPGVAAKIALAGPAVSVAVGVASLVAAGLAGAFGLSSLVVAGLGWLGFVNVALAVFNMLPALPLDGGRVLQAALWKRDGNRHRATIRAAVVGRYFGWGLIAFGIWQFLQGGAGLFTAVIGFFILASAKAEAFQARMALRPTGFGPLFWAPPQAADRRPDGPRDVIDVEVREVDTPA